jgi:hypothetical protein
LSCGNPAACMCQGWARWDLHRSSGSCTRGGGACLNISGTERVTAYASPPPHCTARAGRKYRACHADAPEHGAACIEPPYCCCCCCCCWGCRASNNAGGCADQGQGTIPSKFDLYCVVVRAVSPRCHTCWASQYMASVEVMLSGCSMWHASRPWHGARLISAMLCLVPLCLGRL